MPRFYTFTVWNTSASHSLLEEDRKVRAETGSRAPCYQSTNPCAAHNIASLLWLRSSCFPAQHSSLRAGLHDTIGPIRSQRRAQQARRP